MAPEVAQITIVIQAMVHYLLFVALAAAIQHTKRLVGKNDVADSILFAERHSALLSCVGIVEHY